MERKTNMDGSKGQENSLEVRGWVVKGYGVGMGVGRGWVCVCVGERLWLAGIHSEFIRAVRVKAARRGTVSRWHLVSVNKSDSRWNILVIYAPRPPFSFFPNPLSSFPGAESFWKRWQGIWEEGRNFRCQWTQTIGLFVFERGLTSAGAGWWTSVPAGAGPLEPRCHIKTTPPTPCAWTSEGPRYSCGQVLVQNNLKPALPV